MDYPIERANIQTFYQTAIISINFSPFFTFLAIFSGLWVYIRMFFVYLWYNWENINRLKYAVQENSFEIER